jgi:hypothetical protein
MFRVCNFWFVHLLGWISLPVLWRGGGGKEVGMCDLLSEQSFFEVSVCSTTQRRAHKAPVV